MESNGYDEIAQGRQRHNFARGMAGLNDIIQALIQGRDDLPPKAKEGLEILKQINQENAPP